MPPESAIATRLFRNRARGNAARTAAGNGSRLALAGFLELAIARQAFEPLLDQPVGLHA